MQQEKNNREDFLAYLLPSIATATVATLGVFVVPIAVAALPVALPVFATASLMSTTLANENMNNERNSTNCRKVVSLRRHDDPLTDFMRNLIPF